MQSNEDTNKNAKFLALFAASAVVIGGQGCSATLSPAVSLNTPNQVPTTSSQTSIWSLSSPVLNPKALPLGDGKYTTTGPKAGYVYACDASMYQFSQVIGAKVTGPWVNTTNMTFDPTVKVAVQGTVSQSGQFSASVSGSNRLITGNGLPVGVSTGVFPVSSSDPAYQYDPNPNAITVQNISFSIPSDPVEAATPFCTYKRIGITLDGVEIDAPLDSSGRDENGYELADACGGKPQPGGSYHRQYLSDCVPHIRESNALVGYALDGFGIFSPFDANGKEITSAQLDECHGTTSNIQWNGKTVNMYHYVMTRDYPYTLTCFRGTPNYNAFPALPAPPSSASSPTPTPTPATTYANIDTTCSVFAPDNSTQALSQIQSQTASQCQNDLTMLAQLYTQFQGKTCAQMAQILASTPGPGGQAPPPPPAPSGTLYNAMVTCSKK